MPTTTTRDGVKLYYERHGDAGDPLLLVMGLGGTIDFWQFQTPVLARAHRVCVYDNRGVGRSDKPKGPYTVRTLAEDAVAVLDACGFDRAHVVGLSMGGMIAQELAIRHSDRVGALVLAATYARPDEKTRQGQQSAPVNLSGPATADVKQVWKFMMGLVLTPDFIAREKAMLRELRDKVLPTWSIEGFIAQLAAVMAHDATAELATITSPTAVLKPSNDQLLSPHFSDELARLIPGAKLVTFDNGSHGFNVEQADKFNRAVLDFVAAHPIADAPRF